MLIEDTQVMTMIDRNCLLCSYNAFRNVGINVRLKQGVWSRTPIDCIGKAVTNDAPQALAEQLRRKLVVGLQLRTLY